MVTGDSPDFGWAVKPHGPDGRKGLTGKQFLGGPTQWVNPRWVSPRGVVLGNEKFEGINLGNSDFLEMSLEKKTGGLPGC